MGKVTGKSVLVTGATSGIGEATAIELARRGHQVFATARRTERLAALADNHPHVIPISMDVTDGDSVTAAVNQITQLQPTGVDVLINNAGLMLAGPVETTSDEEARRQFDTNVFGLLNVTRAILPGMRGRGAGRIINISSILGRTTVPASGLYSASKHAVEALSDALRAELRPFGIDVVIVEPGFINTELGDHMTTAEPANGNPYAALTAGFTSFLQQRIAGGADPARLARLLARVTEARRTRTRYLFPSSSRLVIGLSALTPDRLTDRALLRFITSR